MGRLHLCSHSSITIVSLNPVSSSRKNSLPTYELILSHEAHRHSALKKLYTFRLLTHRTACTVRVYLTVNQREGCCSLLLASLFLQLYRLGNRQPALAADILMRSGPILPPAVSLRLAMRLVIIRSCNIQVALSGRDYWL